MRTTLPSGTPVEVARPPGAASRGVVLLPDIVGLRPLYDDLAASLAAAHGWEMAIPEPYPGQEDLRLGDRLRGLSAYDWSRQAADCLAAADLLSASRVAVVGFCLGGAGSIRAAASGRFDRAVAFYGMIRLPEAWQADGVTDPLEDLAAAPGAAARLLSLAGTEDDHVLLDDQDALEALGATVVRYEGATHGFVHDPTAPVHRPADAADAWARATAWLA